MTATKGNKVYTIDQSQQEHYVKEGFDILDDNGKLVKQGAGKTVPYEKYQTVANENAALKKQLKTAQEALKKAKEQKE
jgi:hypothetical protein